MALTDRQNRFYQELLLLAQSREVSDLEKQYLLKAKKSIDSGMSFRSAINILGLNLDDLERKGVITQESKLFFGKLKSVYGAPSYWIPHTHQAERPLSDWRNSDPDFVYHGRWTRRDNRGYDGRLSFKKDAPSCLLGAFNVFLLLSTILAIGSTDFWTWLKKELGSPLHWIVVALGVLLVLAYLIVIEDISMGKRELRKKDKVYLSDLFLGFLLVLALLVGIFIFYIKIN